MSHLRTILAVGITIGGLACIRETTRTDVYTLYRNSVLDSTKRFHVASFNSTDGDDYNRENCEVARGLFQRQPGVTVKYWCEKGEYKK